jgi:hypothetical protein
MYFNRSKTGNLMQAEKTTIWNKSQVARSVPSKEIAVCCTLQQITRRGPEIRHQIKTIEATKSYRVHRISHAAGFQIKTRQECPGWH